MSPEFGHRGDCSGPSRHGAFVGGDNSGPGGNSRERRHTLFCEKFRSLAGAGNSSGIATEGRCLPRRSGVPPPPISILSRFCRCRLKSTPDELIVRTPPSVQWSLRTIRPNDGQSTQRSECCRGEMMWRNPRDSMGFRAKSLNRSIDSDVLLTLIALQKSLHSSDATLFLKSF